MSSTGVGDVSLEEFLEKDEDRQQELLQGHVAQGEAGSMSAQVFLGKYFLQLSELNNGRGDGDSAETEKMAVGWLIKASRQGSDEATVLLRVSVERSQGVTDENVAEVHWCLQTSHMEKIARVAAKKLFRALNPLDFPVLTKEQYRQAVDEVSSSKREKKLLEKAVKFKTENDVSEDVFVEKIVKRLRGSGSLTSDPMNSVESEAYENAGLYQKVTKHTTRFVTTVVNYTVQTAGTRGMWWLKSIVPTQQIYMLLLFSVYSIISLEILTFFLPLASFYAAFFAMVVCTMQMFYSRRKLSDVRAMADMLNRFNKIVDSETTESEYLWHSLRPYWGYFVSLIVVVLTFSFADNLWIPCPELAYISGLLAVACFLALGDHYDYLVVLSIGCNLLSTLPVFFEAFPRIPVLHTMLQLLFGSVFSLQIAPGLFINFGLPSMAYLAVPLLFARMAQKKSWQGTYRVLIPHLVCFFWWQLLVMFYRYASWYGLLRASVGWIVAIFLSPLLVVGLVVWTGAYLVRLLTVVNLLRLLTTVGLLAIPAGVAFWAKSGFRVSRFSISHGSTKAKIALSVLFVASSVPLAYVFAPLEADVSGPSLTWPQYRSLCSRPQWERTNIADTMMSCSHLTGVVVDWTASVKKIVVKRIDNQAEAFLALLPWSVSDPIRCAYGQEYPECSSVDDPRDRLLCDVSTMQGRKCHIKNLNRYTFEIWARLPIYDNTDNGTEFHDVRITATHWYKDVLMRIKDGELVHIRAMLISELGNVWPVLKLYHISCESCSEPVTFSHTGMTDDSLNILRRLARAVFEMCNFFTYPVVQIKYKVTDS